MNQQAIRHRIEQLGIIPAIRAGSAEDALFAVEALAANGLPVAELTMTTPGAIPAIEKLASHNPGLIIGAGTVLDVETARRCLDAGARFLTSPSLNLGILEFAQQHSVVMLPGAMTPTEVITAWQAGCDFVKVFPCSALGGASYIRALRGPFPDVRLIASGGVTQRTAGDFIHAGSAAVGIGRDLVSPEAIRRRQPQWFRELTHRFLEIVDHARRPEEA